MTDRKPILVYDGDCAFCRRWIGRWRQIIGDRVAYAPYQQLSDPFQGTHRERFQEAVHLLESDGCWTRGAEAVFQSLSHAPGHGGWLWLYRHVSGFAAASEWVYSVIARYRWSWL